ncbi:hypothetical protein PPTG_23320 [Phytophthora nicotianae INRA-310]|uniref:Uncharacterized protein n=1 Tax=Phytophthora nicotianae (strain INRA-310) TaxID=761204 RepID=W2Q220_PHYN3|nr:hypothetical protein PPTG_23320 [Phytophthora nicotianae INRA-310]ETN06614.1 hypothetical protein PPTG_23320 [Phytophthora nicotianae INRA-310]
MAVGGDVGFVEVFDELDGREALGALADDGREAADSGGQLQHVLVLHGGGALHDLGHLTLVEDLGVRVEHHGLNVRVGAVLRPVGLHLLASGVNVLDCHLLGLFWSWDLIAKGQIGE